MARVFSAVEIKDEKVLGRLEEIRDTLDLGFNPVSKHKMHITLEFFEEIDEDQVEELIEAMKDINLNRFKIQIKGLGVFPEPEYIRVVWAGIESDKIYDLYDQVADNDVPTDNEHEFLPHITLLRVRSITPEKKRKLKKSINEFKDEEFGEIEVESVKLFESHMEDYGSTYRLIHEEELKDEG